MRRIYASGAKKSLTDTSASKIHQHDKDDWQGYWTLAVVEAVSIMWPPLLS